MTHLPLCGAVVTLSVGLSLGSVAPPTLAQSLNPEVQCYARGITFGASQRDRDRATYLCEGALSDAPARCYWEAVSFGASVRDQDRAARLCRGSGVLQSQHLQPQHLQLRGLSQQGLDRQDFLGQQDFNLRQPVNALGGTDSAAQCYWNQLGLETGDRAQRRALEVCSVQPVVKLPAAIRDCTLVTQRQLGVSRSSALIACTNIGGVY